MSIYTEKKTYRIGLNALRLYIFNVGIFYQCYIFNGFCRLHNPLFRIGITIPTPVMTNFRQGNWKIITKKVMDFLYTSPGNAKGRH
jgi:hypothetical protein